MNQTIHAHQIIHAFARRDGVTEYCKPSRGNRATRVGGRNVDARGIVTAAVMLLPLIATEYLIGDVAPGGWFGDVLNQTSQLLALASPL